MKIICFLSLILMSAVRFTYGQEKITIGAGYVIDVNSTWSVNDVELKEFKPVDLGQHIDIGYNKNTTVWCRFEVNNTNRFNYVDSWLTFNNIHIDSLVMYEDGRIIKILGDRTAFNSRFLEVLALPLKLGPSEERLFYVRVKKEISALDFSFQLAGEEELSVKSDLKISVISFFLGVIFFLIFFNVLLLFISGRRLFLFYILYSLLAVQYVLISTNYAKHLLFPQFLHYSELRIYTSCFLVIALCAFLSHYLGLARHQPIKYKFVVGVNVVNFFLMVGALVSLFLGNLDGLKLPMLVAYLNFLIAIGLICWSTILHFKINRSAAMYVLFAFIPQIVWGVCFILKFFGFTSKDLPVDWFVYISLYEVLLFGAVLTKNYLNTFLKNKKLIKEITLEKERSLQAITQVQIRERRSIANIIHDNFGSKLAYVLQLIQLKNISLAEESIKVLTHDIREISHRILPKSLDEGALISSLKSQVLSLNIGLPDAEIELFAYDFPEKLNEVWIYDLYLISLEIINNSLKHGAARSVILELYGYPDSYVFQFSDDGRGFDPALVPKGFGLENIEKRVKYYKGEFEISSKPGEGTIIQIIIPI